MIRFLVLAVMLSGCSAALQEKLSSGSIQWTEDTEPTYREHPTGAPDLLGIAKRGIITNPLEWGINAHMKCASMFMSDPIIHVASKRERYIMVTAPKSMEHMDSCVLDYWTPEEDGD